MKAAVLFEANTPLQIEDVSLKKPGPHEVLLRTAYAGLCHTDLHYIQAETPWPMPVVLGHESSGIVEAIGSEVRHVKPGDHVVTCLSVFCGTCEYCTTGRPALCFEPEVKLPPGVSERLQWANKEKLNTFMNLSSFAEQMLVHENAIVKIRPDMPLDRACLVGCAVMTGYGSVVNTAKVQPGDKVAVIACGGVGMAAVSSARVAGAERIIAVDTNSEKLDLALKMGATDAVNPRDGDTVDQVLGLTNGGVDHALDCLGSKQTAEDAFKMLAFDGTATLVGLFKAGQTIELTGSDFLRERKIQGSLLGSNRFRVDMPRIIELYMQGRMDLDVFISQKIKLEEINDGFEEMKAGKVLRSLIDFS
jgi:S-(hydroxymethyl)glutathione dehydrogenase/alcohol dehydrogenase